MRLFLRLSHIFWDDFCQKILPKIGGWEKRYKWGMAIYWQEQLFIEEGGG